MADETTTLQVKTQTWKDLNGRKEPGETFDDVIRRLLEGDKRDAAMKSAPTETPDAAEPDLPGDLDEEIERWRSEMERNDVDNIDARVRAAEAVGQLVVDGGVSRSEAAEQLLPDHNYEDVAVDTWWDKVAKQRFGNVESIQWDQNEQQYVVVD